MHPLVNAYYNKTRYQVERLFFLKTKNFGVDWHNDYSMQIKNTLDKLQKSTRLFLILSM
jgi:hypothetical protein